MPSPDEAVPQKACCRMSSSDCSTRCGDVSSADVRNSDKYPEDSRSPGTASAQQGETSACSEETALHSLLDAQRPDESVHCYVLRVLLANKLLHHPDVAVASYLLAGVKPEYSKLCDALLAVDADLPAVVSAIIGHAQAVSGHCN